MSRVVTEIRRNPREVLRIAWDAYEGHSYLDLRLWFEDGPDLKPGKKGFTLRPEQVASLIEALVMAQDVGRELNLLPRKAA
jgi:hypothetical protein